MRATINFEIDIDQVEEPFFDSDSDGLISFKSEEIFEDALIANAINFIKDKLHQEDHPITSKISDKTFNRIVNDIKILLSGLKLVSEYLDKTILKPNNLNYPNSRLLFINSLK